MRLKTKLRQHRRDFTGIYECDHCGYLEEASGYDDAYFHQHVIPNMPCPGCGEKASPYTPKTSPDVPEGSVI